MPVAVRYLLVVALIEAPACGHPSADGLAPAHQETILGAVLSSLDRSVIPNVPFCVSIAHDGERSEVDTTASWTRSTRRRVTSRSQCPPTYETMVLVVDSVGRPVPSQRPPGYVDPYYVTLWGPARLARGLYVVRYEQRQGTAGVLGLCEISTSSNSTHATCTVTSHFVS